MTLIEFFDKTAIENVAGALLCAPDEVVFVGGSLRQMERAAQFYRRALLSRGISTRISFCTVNKNHLQGIYTELEKIVNTCEDCVFDLTGGEDLYLVAVGMILANYPDVVNCHRFNFRNSSILDCDANGEVCRVEDFSISVEENVNIHGGEILRDRGNATATFEWDWNADFLEDVDTMWELCRRDPRKWNALIQSIGKLGENAREDDPLSMQFDKHCAEGVLRNRNVNLNAVTAFLAELERKCLISELKTNELFSFTFKNEQVKRCLTIAGQILEVRIATRMLTLTEKNKQPLYNDCRVGVAIDWDGGDNEEDERFRTVNEIDVLAMHGTLPIFISCKNGDFDTEELYKLNTVAHRFGGSYAKKVLVTSDLNSLGAKGEYLRARAADMSIRILDNVAQIGDRELDRILRSLWLN